MATSNAGVTANKSEPRTNDADTRTANSSTKPSREEELEHVVVLGYN